MSSIDKNKDNQMLSNKKQSNNQQLQTKTTTNNRVRSSCVLTRQKKLKKRGKCISMFCVVGSTFYQNQVEFKSFRSVTCSSFCILQRCLSSPSSACSARLSSVVTVSGSCNKFGVCRRGRRAKIDHPECKASEWPG